MALTPQEIEAAPKVTLAGREWPIPMLAIRQQRVVVPAVMESMYVLARIMSALEVADPAAALSQITITTADYDRLAEAVFAALTRAHPILTKEEFLDLPIQLKELLTALPVVMKQTGMFEKAKGEDAAGEAPAGTP